MEAIMAKKAKRGRPPGSKNKKDNGKVGKLTKNFAKMEVGQLKSYIASLEDMLAAKVKQQKEILEGQLAELQGYVSQKAAGVVRTVLQVPRTGKRAKAKPKYQSKKTKGLKWSGRGMLPTWMREEMKGTKLTKDDFLIK
jgi:DNA-binding protein H-NS